MKYLAGMGSVRFACSAMGLLADAIGTVEPVELPWEQQAAGRLVLDGWKFQGLVALATGQEAVALRLDLRWNSEAATIKNTMARCKFQSVGIKELPAKWRFIQEHIYHQLSVNIDRTVLNTVNRSKSQDAIFNSCTLNIHFEPFCWLTLRDQLGSFTFVLRHP